MNRTDDRRGFGLSIQDTVPSGQAMINGYRDEMMNGRDGRYNPNERPLSSMLVDLKDPIQVHLLTETALADSREWEILSQEEVDGLKKQCQSLTQRIDQTRANLAIQSKYRDAAIAMTRLYSPGGGNKRRSLLGSRGSGASSDAERQAEAERAACERQCEELAAELFALEKRIMEPQRRLLQHTAGILQLTHKATRKRTAADTPANGRLSQAAAMATGIPGSPESLYTYNRRESLEDMPSGGMDGFLDERGLYLPIDLDGQMGMGGGLGGNGRKNAIGIPLKSPIRKETQDLREETARLQNERDQLQASNEILEMELSAQQQLVADAEQQMDSATNRLRDVVVRFNPDKNAYLPGPPPLGGAGSGPPGTQLAEQLRYLVDTLAVAQEEQEAFLVASSRQAETHAAFAQLEGRLAASNGQLQRILLSSGSGDLIPLPAATGMTTSAGMEQQLGWLQTVLPAIENEMGRAGDASMAQQEEREAVQQMNVVLVGLWEMMEKGFAEVQRVREQRLAARQQMGLRGSDDGDESDADDVSFYEMVETASTMRGGYSLEALADKVRWLYQQTTKLREHKSVLKRQVKQQRELNSKSDAQKDEELQNRAMQVEQARVTAAEAQDQLARTLAELGDVQQRLAQKEVAAASVDDAQAQLAERSRRVAALESQGAEMQQALAGAEASVAQLTAQVGEAEAAREAAEAGAAAVRQEAAGKDEELERLNVMLVELKMEAAIAKAELDGAYGSRAQRAADVAALAKSSENSELQGQLDKVKGELAGTLKEYEELTKDTIAAEREKLELEGQLDDALAAKTALEAEAQGLRDKLDAEVSRLKEELDAEKLRVAGAAGGSAGGRAGATMLSEQFRVTMKEERKKFQEELRTEQAQRRKLEDELRTLRRTAGAGKSSPSLAK